MPIYLYRCQQCQNTTEVLQKYGDPAPEACAHCGANALKKTIAPVGVIFKGSGFHKNDYSSTGSKSSGSSSTTPAAPAGESKSSESKPAESSTGESKSDSSTSSSSDNKVA